ncbi:hypothetical protein PR001_g30494 [Phytophthora rubi]|uniref:SWIM-type domain-containing protein n=4 Tax=Phytophthora TaxID=4783 RepID=A0A6A3GT33_9STRA|nr:hypothetical protein PR001_g30494 [Phytophthora rubi]
MFKVVRSFVSRFFEINLVLSFGSLDRSQYIDSAYREVWPSIRLLNCYPHLARKCGAADKRRLLAENDFYEASVAVSIKHLTKARTERQFSDLQRLFLAYWREQGETEYASWFEETYLGSTWMFWYYQAAIPGVTPSQNALESHHKVIKITCVASLRSSTAVVLNDGIPSILFHEASQPLRQDLFHFCEGPLCSEAVANAQRLLENKKNYYQLKARRSRVLFGVLFNATKFIISSTNINGASMDRSRAQRYLDSLSGKLPQDISVRNVELYCLSIHQVKLLHQEAIANFVPSARVAIEEIQAVRRKYACDCAMFAQTGWQCSHVLAVMVLQKEINVSRLLNALPTRKASGGQRKAKSCLAKGKDEHQFSVDVLTKRYLKQPMYPLHWQVMRDFDIRTKAGVSKRESFRGTVVSWGDNNGVYYWAVEFPKLKKTLRLECQELAECTHEAYIHGVDVTGLSSGEAVV